MSTPRFTRVAAMLSLLISTALTAPGLSAQTRPAPEYDVVIRGGTIVDGTGKPAFKADLGIKGDRIVRIAPEGLSADSGKKAINATGKIVSPGFFDTHAHIATNIHEYPMAENFIRQGITTIYASLHSGAQPYPLKPYMDALKVTVNVGFFAGFNYARTAVLGLENRDPTPTELEAMKKIVHASMKDGALGLSSGLTYVPGHFAKTEEVVELAKVASCYGGIYISHMRDEGEGLIKSVEELIHIAEAAKMPGQINHHKAAGSGQWGWSARTLAIIDAARAKGLDITHDVYPYAASSSGSQLIMPGWALAGGPEAFRKRTEDPVIRKKLEADLKHNLLYQQGGADLNRLQFRVIPSDTRYNGKTLADLARDRGLKGTPDEAVQLLIELQLKGGFSAIYHSMDERDFIAFLKHPYAMIETDGDPVGYDDGFPHPRSYGAFPRLLGRYVREQKILTLEEAIRRMTSFAADQIGQHDRGRIREGAFADITIFDPDRIADKATFVDPHQYSVGISDVIVNGMPVIRGGALTGERPGAALRGPSRPVDTSNKPWCR